MEPFIKTYEIVNITLNIFILLLMTLFHIKSHSSDCQGHLLSKTKTSDGHTVIREADLSIHDADHPSELSQFQ